MSSRHKKNNGVGQEHVESLGHNTDHYDFYIEKNKEPLKDFKYKKGRI